MSQKTWIVLFRGVGGKTQLPVKRLREALSEAGFERVATYINSGNAIVASALPRQRIVAAIAEICAKEFGFGKEIFLVSPDEWSRAIERNPFREAEEKPTTLHLFTLADSPPKHEVEALAAKATGTERFAVVGKFLYLHAPDGLGGSHFAPKIETTLKTAMTARNWNTVLKLAGMAREAARP